MFIAKIRTIGLPTVMALLTLISPRSGAPLAVMGATFLTAMRTGAAGALAARLLARQDSRAVGMIGAGVQARAQLLGLSRHFRIEQVMIYDTSQERARSLEEDCRAFLDCEYTICAKPREACQCDILVTTTPSRRPVVEDGWILPGTHINAIGADARGKQELQSALTKRARIFVDDMAQAVHSGEVNVPITEGVAPARGYLCPDWRGAGRQKARPKRRAGDHHLRLHRPCHSGCGRRLCSL